MPRPSDAQLRWLRSADPYTRRLIPTAAHPNTTAACFRREWVGNVATGRSGAGAFFWRITAAGRAAVAQADAEGRK